MRVQAFTDEELEFLTQKFEAWTDEDGERATIKGEMELSFVRPHGSNDFLLSIPLANDATITVSIAARRLLDE